MSDPLAPLKVLDLALLALALPVFLVAGLPIVGWVAGAAVWLMWRGIGAWADRKVAASRDPRVVAGVATGAMIGRGWLMGLTILGVGLVFGRDEGLSAAVLAIVLFTVFFATRMVTRGFDGPPSGRPSA